MQVMRKEDGSIISTYIHAGNLDFKSKMSLGVPDGAIQVKCVTKYVNLPENAGLKSELEKITKAGYTVNMEWTSPGNMIVLPYQNDKLTILCIRNRADGTFLPI